MLTIVPLIVLVSGLTGVVACNKGYSGGHGWGEPVIILPKPTLIPKLKQAFVDGRLSVNSYKILAPSLKPLPFKKGLGWIGKGWAPSFIPVGFGYNHFDYPFGVGKTGYLGVGYGKGYGYGYGKGAGIGIGKGIGVGYGKGVEVVSSYGHGPIGGLGHGHLGGLGHGHLGGLGHGHLGGLGHGHLGGLGHGHLGGLGHGAKLPIPHIGHHTVSQNSVTVVDKGLPHVGIPHGPIGHGLYGKI